MHWHECEKSMMRFVVDGNLEAVKNAVFSGELRLSEEIVLRILFISLQYKRKHILSWLCHRTESQTTAAMNELLRAACIFNNSEAALFAIRSLKVTTTPEEIKSYGITFQKEFWKKRRKCAVVITKWKKLIEQYPENWTSQVFRLMIPNQDFTVANGR